jgi:nitrogen-specific signal transduction histidine kinase
MITSPAIVCNCESTGKCDIKEINCAAENIFSVKRENVVGNKLFELLPDKDGTLEELILSVKKNGLPSHIDSYTFDVENTNGKYEIYMYMLPNGEIVIIFYSID